MPGDRPTVIGRLRVRAGIEDPLLTQLRVERLLNPIELRLAQLPSSAILFIKSLRDPLPGSLRLQQSDIRPPPAWQQAVSSMIDSLAGRASRPARESVSASAAAVVFLDRSELLACMANDWCEGSVMTRWWWQSLLKQGAASQIVKEIWRGAPEYAPAALQQLANQGKAVNFVRGLSDTESRQLLRGVAQSFALPALLPVLDNFETSANTIRGSLDLNPATTAVRVNDQLRITAAPWGPWVPECRSAELVPEQELFLAIGLMLRRAPVKARASEFHASVRAWQEEILLARAGKSERVSSAVGGPATMDQQRRGAADLREHLLAYSPDQVTRGSRAPARASEGTKLPLAVSEGSDGAAPDRDSQEAGDPALTETSGAQSRRATPTGDKRRLGGLQTSGPTNEPALPSTTPSPPAVQSELRLAESESVRPAASDGLSSARDRLSSQSLADVTPEDEQIEDWIETRLGGFFYLINLGLFLNLYGDFATPDKPGIQLNIWDFVALLGRKLVGDDVESDPIWALLRRLAHREEGDLSSFEFRVSSFELSTPVLDQQPETQDSRLETGDLKPETRNLKLETPPAIAAWVDQLVLHVRPRLRQALGLAEEDDPGPLVCRYRAQVCLTPTHLDVFFSLAELPVAVRLAGLDRNPGWVPAAGRFIAFHFE